MQTQAIVYELARGYLKDNSASLTQAQNDKILGWIRSRDLASLASCFSKLEGTISLNSCRVLLQMEAFFKKNVAFVDEKRCTEAAITGFIRWERHCARVNRRLDWYSSRPERIAPDLRVYLNAMRTFISKALGSFSEFREKLPELVRVSSGATATSSRKESHRHTKMTLRPWTRLSAAKYYREVLGFYGYDSFSPRWTDLNRVEVVPKSWKTHRTIACEPNGLMPFQLAFDVWMKRRFPKFGIDLSDQGRNQEYARRGSLGEGFSTLDLEAASDTVSYNTVAFLLPDDWWRYLCNVRSPKGKLGDSSELRYAKFSSMGNGATFALETLIFLAAIRAVGSSGITYGDDIIVETDRETQLLRLLSFIGFRVNADKSHSTGYYRESCGSHWYNGVDVTPFYLRTGTDVGRSELCHCVNGLRSLCSPSVEAITDRLITERKLLRVPFNGVSTSGVWVTVQQAYQMKLFRSSSRVPGGRSEWQPSYKAYVCIRKHTTLYDIRMLSLWYFDASRRTERGRAGHSRKLALMEGASDTSIASVPSGNVRYVTRRVRWYPLHIVPLWLYCLRDPDD